LVGAELPVVIMLLGIVRSLEEVTGPGTADRKRVLDIENLKYIDRRLGSFLGVRELHSSTPTAQITPQ
jgi:hypothetical protein